MGWEITEELIARQPPEAQAIIRLLLKRIEELEGRFGKTPQNSSLPPSTQHPHAKPAPKKPKSKRKRGGQPGHPKHERALIPTEDCHDVQTVKPAACRRCGTKLSGDDPQPLRHQVWEVPEIKPDVTEYQRHRLRCPCCGETTCAPLPLGVPESQAGPRLVALVALLMGCFRQSKRRVAFFCEQVLGQPCSTGWVVKLQNQAAAALAGPYQELAAELPLQEQLSIDETPTKQGPAKSWLWTCVAATFTVFTIRLTRGGVVLSDLLGESYDGVTNCDRAKMYWMLGRLQWCWAHLKRDFQALIDSKDPQARRLGHDLMRQTRKLFELWARYRDGTLSRPAWKRLMHPVRQEVDTLLLRGACSGNPHFVGMCDELSKHRDWLWMFLSVKDVQPTNNAGERALRHAVIWRKLSFGTQSARGSRFVETMLTVVETCRQQSRNVFTYVSDAVHAHFANQASPSLLTSA